MKAFKGFMAILAVVGFIIIILTVSASDYEDYARVPKEDRMTQAEVTTRLIWGVSCMTIGGFTFCKIDRLEEEARYQAFERRKAKFRKEIGR